MFKVDGNDYLTLLEVKKEFGLDKEWLDENCVLFIDPFTGPRIYSMKDILLVKFGKKSNK
jgi:hypothetical protein